jgi:hypothetical protein
MYPYPHPHAKRILELPVYRCTEEQYYREQDANHKSAAQEYARILQWAGHTPESAAEQMKAFEIRWKTYPWDFNEVIGWVRLYVRTGSIGAVLYSVKTKISKNMSRKKFEWDSYKFIELPIAEGETSAEIFNDLRKSIITETHRTFKGKRYIDTGVLDVVGPHLDWAVLTQRTAPRLT